MNAPRNARALFGIAAAGALTAIASCRSVGQPGATALPPPSDTLARAGDGGSLRENPLETRVDASIAAPSSPSSPAAARWIKQPETSGELFSAVDGACPNLRVSLLDNDALVHWGRYNAIVAHVSDDTVTVDPTLSAGIGHVDTLEYITGRWPDQTYTEISDGTRCDFGSHSLRHENGTWKPTFALPPGMSVEQVATYEHGAIGIRHCNSGCGSPDPNCVPGVLMGDNAKAPPISGDGYRVSSFKTMPGGEIFAIGVVCKDSGPNPEDCTGQFRWWAPGGKKVGYATTAKAQDMQGALLVRSLTEVYVLQNGYFGRFDGTKLEKVAPPEKSILSMWDAKGGLAVGTNTKLWQRKTDGTYDDISPTNYPSTTGVSGLMTDTPWSYGKDAIYKRIDGVWKRVDLPKPPFSSTNAYLTPVKVIVRAPDDVFVVASYFEQKPGWNEVEKRFTLLRTKKPKETLRCSASGASSWPAQATDACTTPFVLFAPVSATSPKDYDYPQTRAVLRAKATLAEGSALTEIRENGSVWIGAVPRTLADGKVLAELYASQFPFTRPEVVCLAPSTTGTRRIPIH